MLRRKYCQHLLIICLIVVVVLFILLNLWLILFLETPPPIEIDGKNHRLCVLFPYRDRLDILLEVVPRLQKFLRAQQITFEFILINQTDNFRFNRAFLINIGALEAKRLECDYLALHDVDIVPLNPSLSYGHPGNGRLFHVTPGKYHPISRYDYKNYIGGVLLITLEDFVGVDGMSNSFWGWGLEDDEFFLRLKEKGLSKHITRPINLKTNRSNTFVHFHAGNKKRDYSRADYRRKRKRGRDRQSGLSNLDFNLSGRSRLRVGGADLLVLNVELHCNVERFPECVN